VKQSERGALSLAMLLPYLLARCFPRCAPTTVTGRLEEANMLLQNYREIPELKIYNWTILEILDTFYIDILFHLGSALHNIRGRIGFNSET